MIMTLIYHSPQRKATLSVCGASAASIAKEFDHRVNCSGWTLLIAAASSG
jgi:hypothetical protein